MTVTVEAILSGTTYSLSGGTPYFYVGMTGIGAPPLRRQQERGPFQHGVSDVGVLLDPRVIGLVLFFQADTRAQADTYRDTLMDILKPVYDPASNPAVTLQVTREDGAVRRIDGHVLALDLPDTFDQDRMGTSQRIGVQFYCPAPTWYSVATTNLTFDSVTGGFAIPSAIAWAASGTAINDTRPLTYAGTWPEYPTIEITGPVTDLVITNVTTGDVLDFTGVEILAGDTYTINLAYGAKTVVNAAGTNKVADLTAASDLATWSIVPAPTAPGGVNTIQVTGTGGSAATQIVIRYYDRYIAL